MKDPKQTLDPASLSAFAVYNHLVPGVRSYQDTNTPMAPKGKKSRKRKLDNDSPQTPEPVPVKIYNGDTETTEITKSKKRRNRKKKSKTTGTVEDSGVKVQNTITITDTDGGSTKSQNTEKKKKKKKNKKSKDKVAEDTIPALVNGTGSELKSHKAKEQSKTPPSDEFISVPNKPELVPNPVNPNWAKNAKEIHNKIKSYQEEECPRLVLNPLAEVKSKTSTATPSSTKKSKQTKSPKAISQLEYDEVTASSIPNLASILTKAPVVDSRIHGKSLFEWLIHPVPVTTFFDKYWEKQPLHIKRPQPLSAYYNWILSSAQIDSVLRGNVIKYGKNLDITSYTDGVRETHNPVGRAMPAVVWDYYANGCSVRFLNPQTYVKPLWRLNASLQEYLGTFVGANVYLTPPDSQGFAPHYDDIEAFVLQIEGKKHWKLYNPRSKAEELPLYSSENFKQEDIGEPILDVILEEGDLLYFPRGTIHQARAVEGEHSLHITLSAYQLNSYADFLKLHLPIALEQAIEESVEFRRGLPTDFLNYMGVVHSDNTDKNHIRKRKEFETKIKKLCEVVVNKPCDLAADQLGKKFIWDSLPPFLTKKEKPLTVQSDGEFLLEGQVFNRTELEPDTEVKLLRKNCVRLVLEENSLRLYYNVENSLEYHGEEAQYLEIPEEAGPAIEYLVAMYPAYSKVDDLPLENNIALKLQLVADMWEKGIIITRTGLNPVDDNEMVLDSDLEEEEDEESEIGDEEEDSDDMYEDIEDEEGDMDFDSSCFTFNEDDEDEEDVDEDEDDPRFATYMDEVDSNEDDEEDTDDAEDYFNGASYIEEVKSDEEAESETDEEAESDDESDEDGDAEVIDLADDDEPEVVPPSKLRKKNK